MNFAYIIDNDIVDSDSGINVSLWFMGCKENRCKGCHNPELWKIKDDCFVDNDKVVDEIISKLNLNGIKRNLSILGGDPLIKENRADCNYIISKLKKINKDLIIYLWTGYTWKELHTVEWDNDIKEILYNTDILIDGPYIESLRDVNLKLRGSSNQKVLHLKKGKIVNECSAKD